jgi:hypothetical protein
MEMEKNFCQRCLSVGKMRFIFKCLLAVDYFIIIGIDIKMVNNVYCLHTSEFPLGPFTASHCQCNLENVIGNQRVIYLTRYWERTEKNLNTIWLTCVHSEKAKQWIIPALFRILYVMNIFNIWKFVFIADLNLLCSVIERNIEAKYNSSQTSRQHIYQKNSSLGFLW